VGYIGTYDTLTVALWVNLDAVYMSSLFHCDGWSAGDLHFIITGGGTVRWAVHGNTPTDQDSSYTFTTHLNEWHHIAAVYDMTAMTVDFYIDGADESNAALQLIKGGGAALTREKIVAAVAGKFICIADDSKLVHTLGQFPLPVEVIPMARSHVARELVKLGGDPVYREGVVTDNGNVILDVYNFPIPQPLAMEQKINHITGVLTNGLFALRPADVLLLGTASGVRTLFAE